MSTVGEIFGDGVMTAQEFESALAERGLCLSDSLESRLAEERERHSAELSGVRAQSALHLELMRSGAYNPILAARALSTDGMTGDDGELSREAKVRVAILKKAEPYLFGQMGYAEGTVSTGAPHGTSAVDPDSMSDSEYYRTVTHMG